jgi:ADP-ribosylglycohydrolase
MAQDTVPFALWVAARYLDDFPSAVAACVDAGGDVDTTCAIVGGVVAAYTGTGGIPPRWLAAREPLPEWLRVNH